MSVSEIRRGRIADVGTEFVVPGPNEGRHLSEKALAVGNAKVSVSFLALRAGYAVIGIAAIFAFSYLFGHPLLEGPIKGNDSAYHLSIISWIDQWFPELPSWYPLQGAGASSIVAYPYGAHVLVVIGHRLTGLSLFQVFRIAQFISVPLTATGVYLLVWVNSRKQTAALIAGLFYPLSAGVWPWLTDVGLFGQAFSMIYFAPAFLLFEAYLSADSSSDASRRMFSREIAFALASVTFAAMFITHGATAVIFSMFITLYTVVMIGVRPLSMNSLRTLVLGVGKAMAGIIAGLSLAGFWLLPYFRLGALANREGVAGEFAVHQIPYLDLAALVGLRMPPPEWGMWALSLAAPVVIFAMIGFIFSLRKNRQAVAWGFLALFFAIFTAVPGLSPEFTAIFRKLWANTYVRALIPTMIFVPALAGLGVDSLARGVLGIPGRVIKWLPDWESRKTARSTLGRTLVQSFTALLALSIAYAGFVYLRRPPVGYGPYPGYGSTVGADYWPFDFDGSSVELARPPRFELSEVESTTYSTTLENMVTTLDLAADTRIDISPYLGGLLMELPLHTDASTVNIYAYGQSLIHAMWAYQQGSFFSDEFGTPHEIDELARWFGIEYVILNAPTDPLQKYSPDSWTIVMSPEETNYAVPEVRRFNESIGLATVMQRPLILLVGGYEDGIYEQAFKVLNSGGAEFNQSLVVEGSRYIDDYSLEELRKFDLVLMHGYEYRDQAKAWSRLEEYVQSGGALFFDTGWQYWSADWQLESAPEVFPVRNLSWGELGSSDDFSLGSLIDESDIELGSFSPMIWQGQPWGVSYTTEGLRGWADPILSLNGTPLIVGGQYGDGRVIWSGMNLIGHISTYKNQSETQFLHELITWLLPSSTGGLTAAPSVTRLDPDTIEFGIEGPVGDGMYLLWREAHSPDWRAYARVGDKNVGVPIYRAGPGMMLIDLPEFSGTELTITLEYGLRIVGWAGLSITLISASLLVILTLRPEMGKSAISKFLSRRQRAKPEGKVAWLEDPVLLEVGEAGRQSSSKRPVNRASGKKSTQESWELGNLAGDMDEIDRLMAEMESSDKSTETDIDEGVKLISWWQRERSEE